MTLVMGFSNWGVGYAVDGLNLNIHEISLWMAWLMVIPGILWSSFLIFLRNKLKHGQCVGSVSPINTSGIDPNPIKERGKIQDVAK